MKCRICNNEKGNKEFKVKEMMFGFGDVFDYFQCASCNCLQIKEIPKNISKYYSKDYYSFNIFPNDCGHNIRKVIKFFKDYYAVFNKGLIGKVVYNKIPNEALRSLSKIKLSKESKILDVGCGSGYLLFSLKSIGFKNLLGIDPYIKEDKNYKNGLKILKKTINDINNKFDLIMFHHSFEHISNPLEMLYSSNKLLSDNGVCLIRIPVVDSWAWENYGVNWVQIDAPRHFFLHSRKSMEILAKSAGFRIKEIVCDSTEFQFWGSEQYKKDIPLNSDNSYSVNPSKSIFSKEKIRAFKEKSQKLNLESRGDQAVFYLEKNFKK